MKRGFTLVEIVIVLAIMAIIMGTAVMSVGTGMKSARLRDAARTVQLYTRHAKAVALLKQRPVVLRFEEVCEGGQFVKSRVTLTFSGDATSASGETGIGVGHNGSGSSDGLTRTLTGLVVGADVTADGLLAPSDDTDEAPDPLMAEPREFEGIRIQAKLKEEEVARSRISVFSTADLLIKKRADADAAKREAEAAKAERLGKTTAKDDEKDDDVFKEEEEKESSFSVVYEANGRCDPFLVTVFKDGTDERDGLTVSIGRFGRTVTGD
ncbi:MAG: type II secretion system GspH family protein [Kiritimatiellae bacterium]|nr:type II secretion system GspH family protein [Kiritimatiellia bacterium]